jgi:dTDP-glucose pyrophosphorylase
MKNLTKYIIKNNSTLHTCVKRMNQNGIKTLIVTNKKGEYIGTISSGDVRKAIAKRFGLNKKIIHLLNDKSVFFSEDKINFKTIKKKLIEGFDYVPILNSQKKVINIIGNSYFLKKNTKPQRKKNLFSVVIMSGGKGTRLKPFTNVLPKPLMPIDNKTLIEHVIAKFQESGIDKFNLTLNYKSQILISFFKELQPEYKIEFTIEKKPLGTIGGVKKIKNLKNNILISNCDTIIKEDFNKIFINHKKKKNLMTLIVAKKKIKLAYGVCKSTGKNGKIINLKEKPQYNFLVNTGCYFINKKILKFIPNNIQFDATDLINKLIAKKIKLGSYEINEKKWIDVGQLDEYKKFLKTIK